MNIYLPAIVLYDPFDNGQSNARTFELVTSLKGLKYLEDFLVVLFFYTWSIIGKGELGSVCFFGATDAQVSLLLVIVFDGIADEVLEQLIHSDFFSINYR